MIQNGSPALIEKTEIHKAVMFSSNVSSSSSFPAFSFQNNGSSNSNLFQRQENKDTSNFLKNNSFSSNTTQPVAAAAAANPQVVYQLSKSDLSELIKGIRSDVGEARGTNSTKLSFPSLLEKCDNLTPYFDSSSSHCDICAMSFSNTAQKDKGARRMICLTCRNFDMCSKCHNKVMYMISNDEALPSHVTDCLKKHNHDVIKCIVAPLYTQHQYDACLRIREIFSDKI